MLLGVVRLKVVAVIREFVFHHARTRHREIGEFWFYFKFPILDACGAKNIQKAKYFLVN